MSLILSTFSNSIIAFVIPVTVPENEGLAKGAFKSNALHKEPIEFRPTFQMLLLCNKKPKKIDATDIGAWRRISILKFISKFVDEPNPDKLYEYKKDTYLDQKLKKWKEGFFWILTKYYKILKEGDDTSLPGNPEPFEVIKETQDYRNSNDMIGKYLDAHVQETAHGNVTIEDLFRGFLEYEYSQNNEKSKMNMVEFEEHMQIKWGEYTFTAKGGKKGWQCYAFKDVNTNSMNTNSMNTPSMNTNSMNTNSMNTNSMNTHFMNTTHENNIVGATNVVHLLHDDLDDELERELNDNSKSHTSNVQFTIPAIPDNTFASSMPIDVIYEDEE
jgi:phage/plasmid-associated DNA primase